MTIARLALITGVALVSTGGIRAEQMEITIELENRQLVPLATLALSRATVERIYAAIGIKVKWYIRSKADFSVRLERALDAEQPSKSMGYAMPYARHGTRIHVMLDRVYETGSQKLTAVLLG